MIDEYKWSLIFLVVMNNKSIRWQQRYENYRKAFEQLKQAVSQEHYTILERAGLIQTFEFTLELAWKTLKDFLESENFMVISPREVIQQAFQSGYIRDGWQWMKALESRNVLSHTYDEAHAELAVTLIKDEYFPLLKELDEFFHQKC